MMRAKQAVSSYVYIQLIGCDDKSSKIVLDSKANKVCIDGGDALQIKLHYRRHLI